MNMKRKAIMIITFLIGVTIMKIGGYLNNFIDPDFSYTFGVLTGGFATILMGFFMRNSLIKINK